MKPTTALSGFDVSYNTVWRHTMIHADSEENQLGYSSLYIIIEAVY